MEMGWDGEGYDAAGSVGACRLTVERTRTVPFFCPVPWSDGMILCLSPCHRKAPIVSAKGSGSIGTVQSTRLAKHVCSLKVWRIFMLCHSSGHAQLE